MDVAILHYADCLLMARAGHVTGSAGVRDLLLTDLRMKQVWLALSKHARASQPTWAIIFTEQVCSLVMGPLGFDALSQHQAKRVGEQMVALLHELVELMYAIPIETFVHELYTAHRKELENALDELSNAIATLDGRTACSRMCASAFDKVYDVALARQQITEILSQLATL